MNEPAITPVEAKTGVIRSDEPRNDGLREGLLRGCATCGLVQRVPTRGRRWRVECVRCGSEFSSADRSEHAASRRRAGALALAALALYPPAMMLPVLEVEKMGHSRSATIWSGVVELLASGQTLVGVVVLLCSIVIPMAKIGGIVWLSGLFRPFTGLLVSNDDAGVGSHGRARVLRVIEWLGRWGMVDVLLVAILIAAVKLGSFLQIHPGPGIAAFAGVVIFSMFASACFDPHSLWEDETPERGTQVAEANTGGHGEGVTARR